MPGLCRPLRTTSLAALLLAAHTGWAAPAITAVTPQQLERGKPATLTIDTTGWEKDTQLALLPGGPYSSHRLALTRTPRAIASDGRRAFVAGAGGRLQVIEFPPGAPTRLTAQRDIGDAEITALRYAHGRLLATVAGTGVMLFDVSLPTEIQPLWTYRSAAPVQDTRLGEGEAWLLHPRSLEHLRFAESAPAEAASRWELPVEARGFTLQGDTALIAGPQGLTRLDLSGATAQILAQQTTSGQPRDVVIEAGLALLDDGPGGLVVFDAADTRGLRWLGSHNKRGPITALAVSADRAWTGIGGRSVLAIGLGNPDLPAAAAALRLDAPLVGLAARGDVVFAATTAGVQRLDFGTPAVADISPEGLNLGGSRRGVIRDHILYVADWFSGLHLYDISLPAQPRHLANYHTPGSSKGVALYGDYALVGDDDQGLQIIDISDPQRPRWVSGLSSLGLAYTLKRVGKTLYLADHRGGFQIIDLSDIEHPRILGVLDTPGKSWAIDVVVDGDRRTAFVADDDDGLLVFDVSDPAHITLIGQFNPGGQAEDVVVRDGLAYLAFFDNGLFVLDVRDPRQPRPLAHLDIPGNARGIQLVGDLAYVSGWESGLQVVDIADPATPRIIGRFDTDGAAWGVNVQGDTAYVLDWWGGIKVLDVSDPARPAPLGRYHARGTLHTLRSAGNFVFAASGAGGLQVYDGRNPLNPIWAAGVDLGGEAVDLWVEDSHAYIAAGDAGVAVVDILDPFTPRQVGGLETPGEAWRVRARDDFLFIADRHAGLLVADAREPRRPRLLSRHPLTINDLWVDATGLYVAGPDGLQLLGVDETGSLRPAARYPADGVQRVRSTETLVAITLADGTVQLLRPGDLAPLGRFQAGEPLRDLALRGERLYLLGERSGLLELDVADPASPRLTTVYPASGRHTTLALRGGGALLGGERRMASLTLLPPVTLTTPADGSLRLQLPAGTPAGRYHLRVSGPDGVDQLLPNAFTLRFGAPGAKRFNLDTLRRLLKRPLSPPPGP